MRRHRLLPVTLFLALASMNASAGFDLPDRLTDREFWSLMEDMSEPDGVFQSDNLLSNEIVFARIVPDLIARTKPGGVYLGVGPEQNFTYIAAIRPRIAFITDIRRGNLHTQLMYKALFELSADRAEFVSRLFTKPRQGGLTPGSTATELMNAYWDVRTSSEPAYEANLEAIKRHLTRTHALPLSAADLDGIARVYRTFYWYGPAMNYSASTLLNQVSSRGTTYRDLMTQGDSPGPSHSFLASEERFQFLKDLEGRNLVIPVVANFSGPKALRAIGTYLKTHAVTVTAFYLSNVEDFLSRAGTWQTFCANVATLPLDEASMFIRPSGIGRGTFQVRVNMGTSDARILSAPALGLPMVPTSGVVPIAAEVKGCAGGTSGIYPGSGK